ncbi:MAG: hypothetical protein RIQ59_1110 [Bacteroidota bacterium]|jgi:hypothetical protein
MKIYLKILLLTSFIGNAQSIVKDSSATEKDSIAEVKSSWYGRTMFTALTTGSDTKGENISQRMTRNIEFGRSIGSVDIGLALGEFKHMAADSSGVKYSELRVSMDACQYGIFSNEISVGAGYVFNSKTPVMMEISSTLYAQVSDKFGIGFVFGNIDFVGDNEDSNKSFFGLYLRYGLIRNEGGILTNKLHLANQARRHNNRKRTKIF